MARPAKILGYAPIYETSKGLQVRRSEIRPANNRNYDGFDDDDDFGDDDEEYGYDGDDDDDDFGDDDQDVDFAGPRRDGRRERRGNRRNTRRANSDDRRGTRNRNQDRRESTREANRASRRGGGGGSCKSENGSTKMATKMLSGANTATGSGVASTITIRPQFDFVANDITFAGADTGAEISSIYFGAVPVWSAETPIPISIFATTSFKNQDILAGAFIKGGLDIIIHYISGASSKLTAVVTGAEG